MANPTPAEPVNPETPSQGIFLGYLGLVLLVVAVLVAAFVVYAGASHGFN
jgi:hypothetical protein